MAELLTSPSTTPLPTIDPAELAHLPGWSGDRAEPPTDDVEQPVSPVVADGVSGQGGLDSSDRDSMDRVRDEIGTMNLAAGRVPLVIRFSLVITQSCDIEHKDYFTLAQVLPLAERVLDARNAIARKEPLVLLDVVRSLTEGIQHPQPVYLGAPIDSGRMVADLLLVQSFGPGWKCYARCRRIAGLNDEALKHLQGRPNMFTGRHATEAGFWKTPQDHQVTMEQAENDTAIEDAYRRLRQKLSGSGQP